MKTHLSPTAIEVSGARSIAQPAATMPPVMLWAGIGAVFLSLAVYVGGTWILSDAFRPAPVGSDALPLNVLIAVRGVELVSTLVGLILLWRFVFAPLLKSGTIGFDGMLLINFLLIWWTDPIDNYVNFSFMYNGHFVNMGSWANFIPGWGYPNQENLPEPLLMMGGFYLGFYMLNCLFGCWLLRRLAERWSALGLPSRIAILFVTLAIIDLVVEVAFMRTGVAAYPGVVRSLSLFPGEVYQWPLYEAGIIAFVNVSFISLRYFKNDRGRSFVERGIDKLRLSARTKGIVTFLAIAGFVQPLFLFGYYIPYNLFAIHSDTFPAYPSYMRNMICGEGTQYACPSRDWIPIPQRGSQLYVRPDDPRLPQEVRDAQSISASGKDPYAWD